MTSYFKFMEWWLINVLSEGWNCTLTSSTINLMEGLRLNALKKLATIRIYDDERELSIYLTWLLANKEEV